MTTTTEDLFYKSASDLSSLLNSGELSSKELTQSFIDRTQAVEPKVDSFLKLDPEMTLKMAEESDARRAKGETNGPLDGIPVSLKDNICHTGQSLTCGGKFLENYISPYSATVTENLTNSGAVLWGRLNMDEMAMGSSNEHSAYKKTNNPWDTSCVPGGSSGGSASSVASGQTVISLGSDTGGSIRQPAAHCGIVGLKPTYGLVSRYGLAAFASSLDQIGPLTRTVKDSALALQSLASHDPRDSTSSKVQIPNYTQALEQNITPKKIGVPKECLTDAVHPDVLNATHKAIDFYKSQGHEITEISLPSLELSIPVYYIIAPAEASSNLARYDGVRYTSRSKDATNAINIFSKSREEGFGREVKRRIILGTYVLSSGYYDAYYLRAQKVRTLICQDFKDAFQNLDVILTPTTPNTAFKKGEKSGDPLAMYLEDLFTISANLAGLPGISIPSGFDSDGMPIGLQLIGRPYQETDLLAIAHQFEINHDFVNKHPSL